MHYSQKLDKDTIISRIKLVRQNHVGSRGKALFAKAIGANPSTYNCYEKDRMPPVEILWAICQVTDTDLYWLLTGEIDDNQSEESLPPPLNKKLYNLMHRHPDSLRALNAFLELLDRKSVLEKGFAASNPKEQVNSIRPWIPILGRTAAGIINFWKSDRQTLPDENDLNELIRRHIQSDYRTLHPGMVTTDHALPNTQMVETSQACLVQLTQTPREGISEFIESTQILNRYADAFALRVDGDSMSPHIDDGSVVIISPSVSPGAASTCVIKLKKQIGLTCKILRSEGTKVHLIPANEKYEHKIYDQEQIEWALPVLWTVKYI